ncbi:MAG: autotransporter-associated beta strand repeat-containing protein [Candidatus Methylacidiphilales bacterium]|nr:autotransporter-associated beta strand repeat-containing protein [Candidatus Methylacidiphilales bacterium]
MKNTIKLFAAFASFSWICAMGHAANITFSSGNYTNNAFTTGSNWVGGVAPGGADVAVFNTTGDQFVSVTTGTPSGGFLFSSTTNVTNSYAIQPGALGVILNNGSSIELDSTYRGIASFGIGTGGGDQALSLNGTVTLNSSGVFGSGIIVNRLNTRDNTGAVTLNLDGTNSGFRAQYGNILTGVISQNATVSTLSVVKNGSGTWVLNNANTYTGGTTLNAGTLVVNNATALGTAGVITIGGNATLVTAAGLSDPSSRITINDGATFTVDTAGNSQTWSTVLGNSGGSNTAGLTKTGLGQLTMAFAAGQKQTYKGDTTINAGLLFVDGSLHTGNFTNLIDSSSDLILGGGSLYFRGNSSLTSSQTFASTTLKPGVSEFRAAAGSGTNTIDFASITRDPGALLSITTVGGFSYKATGTANDAGGLVKGVVIGNDFATNNGSNLVATTYTTQNNSTLWTSPTANYTTGAAVTGTVGNATINSLRFANASNQNVTITGTLAVNDGILFTSTVGANNSQISGGNLTGPSGGGDLIIVNNNNRNQLGHSTIASNIVDNGGVTGLVLLNSGTNSNTLYLTGANSYTGNTTIGGGTNASTGTHVVLVGGASGASIGSSGATVLVNGGSGGLSNVLRVGNNDATGNVLGTLNLQNGRLSLNRNDTFTLGATVGSASGMGSITLDSTGNATVNLASGVNNFATLSASAGGTLNLSGAGIYNFNSAWTGFNGTSTVNYNSGKFFFNATSNAANVVGNQIINGADVTLAGGRYFGSGGGNLTLNSGSFKINGTSMNMENNGVNNFVINVNGGTFIATPNTNSGSLSALALGGGTASSTGNATFNQTGGQVNIGAPDNNLVAANNINSGLAIGAGNSTVIQGHTSSYNLSGGTLRVFGAVSGAGNNTTTNGTSNFNWTGGTLTAGSYLGGNLLSSGSNNTLVQDGATTVMAPGDTYQGTLYSGRTAITGGYQINSGTLALGIGGTTAASSYHETSTNRYDNVSVSGATTLGGRLALTLNNGYTPPSDTTTLYNIVTGSASGVTGSFTNGQVASGGNTRVVLADGLSSMLVAVNNTGSTANVGGLTNVGSYRASVGGYESTNTYNAASDSSWDAASAGSWTVFDAGSTASPSTQASGAIAQFADGAGTGVGANTVNLSATRNIQGVQFASAVAGHNYTIANGGSGALILDNTGNNAAATLSDTSASGNTNTIAVPLTLNSNLNVNVANAANTLAVNGGISGTGRALSKTGNGTLSLSGNINHTGATTVNGGTLLLASTGNLSGTSGVVINAGGTFRNNSSIAVTAPVTLNGGTIAGTGTINSDLALNSLSDVLSPGNSPGTLNLGAGQNWSSYTYDWETNNFIGTTAGTDYDRVAINGSLTLTGASTGVYELNVLSLTAGNLAGLAPNFSEVNQSWTILSTTGGITGFNSSFWTIDTAGFTNLESGTWAVAQSGNDLVLSYTAIPEPSTYALLGIGLAALMVLRRRSARPL